MKVTSRSRRRIEGLRGSGGGGGGCCCCSSLLLLTVSWSLASPKLHTLKADACLKFHNMTTCLCLFNQNWDETQKPWKLKTKSPLSVSWESTDHQQVCKPLWKQRFYLLHSMCVNMMPRGKDITCDFRETSVWKQLNGKRKPEQRIVDLGWFGKGNLTKFT